MIERLENWATAAAICRALDAYLAEPRTKEENDFVKQLSPNVWLGGQDLVTEGKWFWGHSGAPVKGFTNWYPGEPNNHNGTENCMVAYTPYKGWNDAPCNRLYHFICQKDLSTDLTG